MFIFYYVFSDFFCKTKSSPIEESIINSVILLIIYSLTQNLLSVFKFDKTRDTMEADYYKVSEYTKRCNA